MFLQFLKGHGLMMTIFGSLSQVHVSNVMRQLRRGAPDVYQVEMRVSQSLAQMKTNKNPVLLKLEWSQSRSEQIFLRQSLSCVQ